MRLVLLGVLLLGALPSPLGLTAAPTPLESGFTESIYATDSSFSDATGLAWAPDGTNRLFVITKGGQVKIVKGTSVLTFATVSPVYTASECGLVGICFDPNFASSGHVYLFVTVSSSEQQIIRYTASGDTGTNKTILKAGLPTRGANHDGGAIEIGPDGKLYWAIGDLGAGIGVDADLSSYASKVCRMNLDGTAPADNPFYNASDGITATDFIWARGFRNPFTLTFQPSTGAPWVNVVGDGWEQIFLVTKGSHAGYNDYENNQPTSAPYIRPKFAYRTNQSVFGGCVTGGTFYTGTAFPSSYQGNFFFCDYNSDKVMRMQLDGSNNVTSVTEFITGILNAVDIAAGPDGALYYVGRSSGRVYRLASTASTPQNIVLSATSMTIDEGGSGTFTLRLAAAPSANVVVNVNRSSGDADVANSPSTLTFTPTNWSTPQTVAVSAAEDADMTDDGATITCSSTGLASQNVTVTVRDNDRPNTAPTASITRPLNGQVVWGSAAEFYGDGTDDAGTVKAEFYVDGALAYTDSNTTGHYHYGGDHNKWDTTAFADGTHTLRMTVYDAQGLSGSHEVTVTVANQSAFQQDSGTQGIVSMEAENFHGKVDQGGHSWTATASPSGASGGALASTPNNGANVNTGYSTGSPRLDFQVNFVKTGTHYVWIRGAGPSGTDDSCHVGLDGAELASSDRISSFGTGWTWSKSTMDGAVATVTVASAGVHTLNVWMREDGFAIDKIVLTTDSAYAPSGTGPAESPRGGGAGGAPPPPPPRSRSPSTISPARTSRSTGSIPRGSSTGGRATSGTTPRRGGSSPRKTSRSTARRSRARPSRL